MKRVKAVLLKPPNENRNLRPATVSMEPEGSFYCSVPFEYNDNVAAVEDLDLKVIRLKKGQRKKPHLSVRFPVRGDDGDRTRDLSRVRRTLIPAELHPHNATSIASF